MIKYTKIINNETGLCEVGLGTNTDFYKSIGMAEQDVEQSEKDGQWYVSEKCPHYTEEELAQKERDRVNKLTVTKRVFALALEQFGVTYSQLKEVIASNERTTLEWDLCVELERGNPLLDQLAPTFNVTSEQLDYIFKFANGEIAVDEVAQT